MTTAGIFIISFSQDRAQAVANAFGIPARHWSRLSSFRSTVGLHEPRVLDCGIGYREVSDRVLAEYADILRHLRERSNADRIPVGNTASYASFIPTDPLRRLFARGDQESFQIAFDIIRTISTACQEMRPRPEYQL